MDATRLVTLSMLILCYYQTCCGHSRTRSQFVRRDGSLMISKGGKFALGFFSPGSSSYRYLGIWYHGMPNRTVVWVANRDYPIVGNSGVLSISRGNCDLSLHSNSSSKVPVWFANVPDGVNGSCDARLLDTGNLVLVGGRSKRNPNIVWQSFDHPTDTLLPGMKVGMNRRTGSSKFLTSWRSVDDPGTGDFSYKLNPNGSAQFFLYRGGTPYWRSVPWPWEGYLSFLKDSFVNNEDGIYYSNTLVNSTVQVRVVIDHSGLFESMTWDEDVGQWNVFYSSPKQKCDFYGTCGPNAKCYASIIFPYECECLPGYEPRYPKKWRLRDRSGGCVRKRAESSSVCGGGEGFVRVEKVKIPDASTAIWMDVGTDKLKCEAECRKNCACSAYATIDIVGKGTCCWTWRGELMDTVHIPVNAYDLYVRVDALELADYLKDSNGFVELRLKLSIIVPSVVSVWIVIVLLAYLWIRKWKRKRVKNRQIRNFFQPTDSSNSLEDHLATRDIKRSSIYPELPFFSLGTIHEATDGFSSENKIGQGGFGSVYKGKLSSGHEVAVKRMSKNSREGLEQLKNEVFLIAKLQHRNLVKLHGCCIEEDEQMLVYEYLPYNSLDSLLFVDWKQRSFLDWRKRFDIIEGIARGILYLHQDSRFRIIHRDLKPSNILLDAELNPKISDFGMARILDSGQIDGKTSKVCGTYGYMPPEYAVFGRYSVKSDVFSFGVILLETVTGKKINGFCFQDDPSLTLIGHVWELWRAGRANEAFDSSMSIKDTSEVLRCIKIGLVCVEENAEDRPDMLAVVLMLNSVTTPVPSPQKPAFVASVNPKLLLSKEHTCSINEMSFSGILSR